MNAIQHLTLILAFALLAFGCENKPGTAQDKGATKSSNEEAGPKDKTPDDKPSTGTKNETPKTTQAGGDPIEAVEAGAYYCPMAAEWVQDGPGTCPICGMKVVQKEGERAKTASQHPNHPHNAKDPAAAVTAAKHYCPMGAEWVQDEPGKCLICGMNLKLKEDKGAHMMPDDKGMKAMPSKQALTHQGEARIGDKTMCPVMGGEFVVTEKSPSVKHEGKDVYFCCPGCDGDFMKDPATKLDAVNKKIDETNSRM